MLKFLLTGTLRCGSAYSASVFNRLGIACGHGWVYTADGVRRYPELELLGDAAPLAAPLASDFEGLVLHQVRHPLKVVSSLAGSGATSSPLTDGPAAAYLARHFAPQGDPLEDAMRYYVEWNRRCERHNGYLRYRIEDFGAALILRIADLIGQAVETGAVAEAFAAVPADFNTSFCARHLNWDDLPAGSSRDALEQQARRYGYAVADRAPQRAEATPQ